MCLLRQQKVRQQKVVAYQLDRVLRCVKKVMGLKKEMGQGQTLCWKFFLFLFSFSLSF